MKILNTPPPNYEKIKEKLPKADFENGTMFTYGDTVHSKYPFTADLGIHEMVHCEQQGDKPEEWWDKYLNDVEFRLSQEAEAYRKQYQWLQIFIKDRNKIATLASNFAKVLSSEMYGSVISYGEALKKIRW